MTPTGKDKALDVSVTFRIPSTLREKLQALADADRRPLSDYVRLVLEGHVAKKRK